MSTPQRPELHRDAPGQQEPCCFWTCLHHTGLSYTWTCLLTKACAALGRVCFTGAWVSPGLVWTTGACTAPAHIYTRGWAAPGRVYPPDACAVPGRAYNSGALAAHGFSSSYFRAVGQNRDFFVFYFAFLKSCIALFILLEAKFCFVKISLSPYSTVEASWEEFTIVYWTVQRHGWRYSPFYRLFSLSACSAFWRCGASPEVGLAFEDGHKEELVATLAIPARLPGVVMSTISKRRRNEASILASFSISKWNKPAYSRTCKDRSEANPAYSTP